MRSRLALVFLAVTGCGGAATSVSERGPDAVLAIDAGARDASVWVDGTFVAELGAATGGIALSPGAHRIEIRRDGYHSHYMEVTVQPGERRAVRVELAEDLQ